MRRKYDYQFEQDAERGKRLIERAVLYVVEAGILIIEKIWEGIMYQGTNASRHIDKSKLNKESLAEKF